MKKLRTKTSWKKLSESGLDKYQKLKPGELEFLQSRLPTKLVDGLNKVDPKDEDHEQHMKDRKWERKDESISVEAENEYENCRKCYMLREMEHYEKTGELGWMFIWNNIGSDKDTNLL